MCDKKHYQQLRDTQREHAKKIAALSQSDAVQSVQIAGLLESTREQGRNQQRMLNRLIAVVVTVLVIAMLALVYGAIGENGFRAVTTAAPALTTSGEKK